jgi:uncharacterized protein RhaS with RHS repeats
MDLYPSSAHNDLATTLGLVNSSNVLQTQYTYDPYGNVTSSGQASSYPYLFAGMELDLIGLYHTQTRYYNPAIGRFLIKPFTDGLSSTG